MVMMAKSRKIGLYWTVASLFFHFRSVSTQTLSLEAFSGVYIQEVPTSSIFYTTLAPLVYGFKVPDWTQNETVFPLFNCSSPMWNDAQSLQTTCPIMFYLPQVQSVFSEYLFNGRPLLHRLRQMGAAPQNSEIHVDCHKLGRHFKDVLVDAGVMERYLAKLKECSPIGDMDYFRHITSYDYNISAVYRKMHLGFFNEVWLKVGGGRIDAGLWSNAQSVMHALNFLNYHAELSRWHLALSDCEGGRIPSSLVTPELIGDTLQELFEALEPINLLPVIAAGDVGNYFRNPLADCTFTNDSLVLRVLVPVVDKNRSYSLYSIRPASFYDDKSGRYCQLQLSNDVFLFDNLQRVAYDTNCNPTEFCHAPSSRSKSDGKVNSCASALLNQDWEDALEYCPFKCYALTKYHIWTLSQPLTVSQMDADKFLVTGSTISESEIVVTCQKNGSARLSGTWKVPKMDNSTGALEVTVPCGCFLTVRKSNYTLTTPCLDLGSKPPRFKQTVPFQWLRDVKMTLLTVQEQPGSSYFKISEDDLKIVPVTSSAMKNENNGSTGIMFFLIICTLLTLSLFIVVVLVVRKLMSLGVNLFNTNSIKIPGSVSYQHIMQPEL